ncbi:MAG TPA: DUF4180 domain-containing protein [Longimicrobium sp.]
MSTHLPFEPESTGSFDPAAIVTQCVESGAEALLLDRDALPPAFFDLSSGVLGDLVGRLTLYRIRMAAVVPDLTAHSLPFQDFVREANRGAQFRFFATRDRAAEWLSSGEAG